MPSQSASGIVHSIFAALQGGAWHPRSHLEVVQVLHSISDTQIPYRKHIWPAQMKHAKNVDAPSPCRYMATAV